MAQKSDSDAGQAGVAASTSITRRDFAGGTLLGTGAALLTMAAPSLVGKAQAQTVELPLTDVGPEWTGPGGVGDYRLANGDTHREVQAAHGGVRNREYDKFLESASDTGEQFDVIIIGSGISALSTAYYYHKERPNAKVLLLENHQMFGGEARRSEFLVDGHKVFGAQGPSGYRMNYENPAEAKELGLPEEVLYAPVTGVTRPGLKVAHDLWTPRMPDPAASDILYAYEGGKTVLNPWSNLFKDAPISQRAKDEISRLCTMKEPPFRPQGDVDKWLDTMTYQDLLVNIFKTDPDVLPEVLPYFEEGAVTGGHGLGADVYSAWLAKYYYMPGARLYADHVPQKPGEWMDELPGGNVGIARMYANKLIKGLYKDQTLTNLLIGPMNLKALDDRNQAVRIRLGSTAIAARHVSASDASKGVVVHYFNAGKIRKVHGKALVVSTPQQIGKRIVQDLPSDYREAMAQFHMAPILTVNVALRNWRFMENMGCSGVRFVDGIGDFGIVTQKIKYDGKASQPCDPNKPIAMTMYQAFGQAGVPYPEQATSARMAMFSMSYADIEGQVRSQFKEAFAAGGYNEKRDLGGIITARQGHAVIVSPPGTFYGANGKPPRSDILRQRYNRIIIAHGDLPGTQDWFRSTHEGQRAAKQLLEIA